MGIAAGLGAAAAGASLASSASSMFGDSGGGGFGGYMPAYFGLVTPGLQQASSNIQNNPYTGQQMAGAEMASAWGLPLAAAQYGGASNLQQAGNQILSTGFDPQDALYNRTQQRVRDQLAAQAAASGLSASPYGAGVVGQGLSDFNINWENNQLGRQLQALQGAGQGYTGAAGLGSTALSTLTGSQGIPYSTYQQQGYDDINALNALSSGYSGAIAPSQTVANMLAAYMGMGQTGAQVGMRGQAQGFGQDQILGSQFGGSLESLSTLFAPAAEGATPTRVQNAMAYFGV
jgi:hypothetical protein